MRVAGNEPRRRRSSFQSSGDKQSHHDHESRVPMKIKHKQPRIEPLELVERL